MFSFALRGSMCKRLAIMHFANMRVLSLGLCVVVVRVRVRVSVRVRACLTGKSRSTRKPRRASRASLASLGLGEPERAEACAC